ncbi:Uncharacterized protein SCF082_LOCUS16479, partial [Durusdinium trenchii]
MFKFVLGGLVTSLCLTCATKAEDVPIRVSKETTYVTEPKLQDGFVDLAGAINARLSEGVTTDNNVAAVLFYWMGPDFNGTRLDSRFYEELGIPVPPDNGDYFLSLGAYLNAQDTAQRAEERTALLENLGNAQTRPWKADEFPQIAAWLAAQAEPLDKIIHSLERERYYSPLIPAAPDEKGQALIATLLPHLQQTRSISRALLSRAMLHLGHGRNEAAWADIRATLRLGRHIGHGASLIDCLVGIAVEQMAHQAALTFVAHTMPNREWCEKAIHELERLPPRADVADAVTLFERLAFIDVIVMLSTDVGDRGELLGIEDGLFQLKRLAKLPWIKGIDWNETARVGNDMYDKLAAAMRMPTYAERLEAFALLQQEIDQIKQQATRGGLLTNPQQGGQQTRKATGQAIGEILVALLVPALTQADAAQTRAAQNFTNVRATLALAAYHADHDRYPESVADL